MDRGLAHIEVARGVGLAVTGVEEGAQIGIGDFTSSHKDRPRLKETSLQAEDLSDKCSRRWTAIAAVIHRKDARDRSRCERLRADSVTAVVRISAVAAVVDFTNLTFAVRGSTCRKVL
jgi:hypothetical protein